MYESISGPVQELQQAYRFRVPALIRERHDELVRVGLSMVVESSASEQDRQTRITGDWSDHGSEGAAAMLKAVELAEQSDVNEVGTDEKALLVTVSALEYYRCGRHGVAAAILDRTYANPPEESKPNPAIRLIEVLQPFCSADFETCWNRSRELIDKIRGEMAGYDPEEAPEYPIVGNLAVVSVAQSLLSIREHLQTGDQRPLDRSRAWINRVSKLARAANDPEVEMLVQSFTRAYRWLRKLSIWNLESVVASTGESGDIFDRWIKHRIGAGMPFLFPTQYEALIGERVLADDYALASMPTGGGKSLLAEVSAIRAIDQAQDDTVIMIVPTRALANEKRDELEEAVSWDESSVSVCQLTGDVAFDTETALKEHEIIVCTPEKFDVLLRERFFEVDVGAVIVDEFHTIRKTYRGVKLQLSIARFQELHPSPILFISAIVRQQDFQALAHWASSPQPFSSQWKPTPSRIGLVALDEHPWHVEFNDGAFQTIDRPEFPRRNATVEASIQIVSEFLKEDQVLHFNLYRRGHAGTNQLLELAERYSPHIPEMDYLEVERREELLSRLGRLVGDEHPLTEAFRKGVAIHWGELPHAARGIMEEAVREKAVGLVLATSTLAAGVNLPLKTVYVPKLARSTGPLEIGQFLNVIGRAGRPFQHPEGQVIVASCEAGREAVRTPREEAEKYRDAGSEDVERIRTAATQAGHMLRTVEEWGLWENDEARVQPDWRAQLAGDDEKQRTIRRLLAEIENLSAALLAALEEELIAGIAESERLREVIFIGPEKPEERENVEHLLQVVEQRMKAFEAVEQEENRLRVTEWGRAVYRTGFGPESCIRLRETLHSLWPRFSENGVTLKNVLSSDEDREIFDRLLELLVDPREASRMAGRAFDYTDVYILRGWVAGVLTQQIAETHGNLEGDYLKAYTRLEGLLSAYGAWVLYAAHIIALHVYGEGEERARELLEVARSIWYGHYDGRIKNLMKRDTSRELLRDDVIVAFHALEGDQFEALLDGELPKSEMEHALLQADDVTKHPEREVAEILVGLQPSEAGSQS